MPAYKPLVIRVTLNAEHQPRFKRLKELVPDLSDTQLAAVVMGAALRALEEADFEITLPLTLVAGQQVTMPSVRRR